MNALHTSSLVNQILRAKQAISFSLISLMLGFEQRKIQVQNLFFGLGIRQLKGQSAFHDFVFFLFNFINPGALPAL